MQTEHFKTELRTDRLLLRRPVKADFTELYAIYSDVLVAHWLNWPAYTDIDKFTEDIERYKDLWNSGQEYYWVIELTATSTVIGNIVSRINGNDADIGFMLNPQHHGQGYATEAAKILLNELISAEKINRVVALTAVGNDASAAVLKKIGMQQRGVAENFMTCPNISDQPRDALIFSVDCT